MAKIESKIEKVGPSKIPGCNQYKIWAGSGKGLDWKRTGYAIVDLPHQDATLQQFIAAMGGEKAMRSLCMDAKQVVIRAQIANRLKSKTASKKSDIDLD